MTPPPANHEALNTGIAWFQLIVGSLIFIVGLRGTSAARLSAPVGLTMILSGVFKFLTGRIPDVPLLTVFVLCFAGVGAWWWRERRAHKARIRALAERRAQSTF